MQEQGAGLHLQVGFFPLRAILMTPQPSSREELEAWEQDGLLTLHTAFSRDQVGVGFHKNISFPSLSPLT